MEKRLKTSAFETNIETLQGRPWWTMFLIDSLNQISFKSLDLRGKEVVLQHCAKKLQIESSIILLIGSQQW